MCLCLWDERVLAWSVRISLKTKINQSLVDILGEAGRKVSKCKQTLYQHGLKNNLKSQITICKYIQGCLLLETEINYKCLTLTITVIIFGGERLRASEDHLSLRTFLKNNAFFKLLIFKKVIKCLYLALIIARNRNLKTVVILYSIKQQKLDRINIRQWEKHVFLYSVSLL